MNIVERIQKEYPANWFVMDDRLSRTLTLEFATDIPQELQNRLEETLVDRFGLRLSSAADLFLRLQTDESTGHYQLVKDDRVCFSFYKEAAPIAGTNYCDCTEAIAWVVYLLSTAPSNNLLATLRGGCIACRVLCARQQTIAAEYRAFTQNQYSNSQYTDKHYEELCKKLAKYYRKFIDEVPRPSGQPIRSEAFDALKKRFLGFHTGETLSSGEAYKRLFGDSDFSQIIDIYCEHVPQTDVYRVAVEKAVTMLADAVRGVPIAAANSYLSGLHHYISRMTAEEPDENNIQCDAISLTRDCQYLRNALAPFDNAWEIYAKRRVVKDFLLRVQELVDAQMDEELKTASRVVQDARISLNTFSVLETGKRKGLTWQHLAEPETADIYVPDTEWTCDSFGALQRVITTNDAWLCSQKLLAAMQQGNNFAQGMDRTYGVPLSNDQYVWVFWRTEE